MSHDRQIARGSVARERLIVGMLLAAWLTHLLAYVWLVPPWQHYDEPTHFEYAALIRELGRLPSADEHIPALRRAIAASMIEAGFYSNRTIPLTPPDLDSPNLSLGVNERGHPPPYYLLVALATAPVRDAPITTQLYVARLLSVFLAVVLFLVGNLTLWELAGTDKELRYMTLAALALQPAFADIMSAVNSDVLANLVAVLLLQVGARFLRRRSLWRLLAGAAVLLIAFNVKRVLLVYALVMPFAFFLALPSRVQRRLASLAGIGLVGACAWLVLQPWRLADWSIAPASATGYISNRFLQPQHGRELVPYSGDAAFVVETRMSEPLAIVSQRLDSTQMQGLAGKRLTLAAWMRSDRNTLRAAQPIVLIDDQVFSQSVVLDTNWQLVTQTVDVPRHAKGLEVQLRGPTRPGKIWYDALTLIVGDGTNLPAPSQPDASFEAGLLGEQVPPNLLRNADAERQIPPLPEALRRLSGGLLDQEGFRRALSKLFDREWIAVVYPRQIVLLFQGFWGLFGWGERSVSPGWFVSLGLLVLASLIGVARISWRDGWPGGAGCMVRSAKIADRRESSAGHADKLHPDSAEQGQGLEPTFWWLCLFAIVLGWGAALLRVHSQPFAGVMFWSFGRYAFVALIPSLLVFCAGLRACMPARLRAQGLAGILSFLVLYAVVALAGTVVAYPR
ncbi:MAG TPA: DUF2142 domain-containing protein [Roseiflexaceae bacterium]|nr:DUF2142 domain-containing protein [Roseiflexaceae bacterium]